MACLLLVFAGWHAQAHAQEYNPKRGDPPSSGHIQFTYNQWNVVPTAAGKGIKGWIRLDCYEDEYDEVHIRLTGLHKRGRYTVWCVDPWKPGKVDRVGVAQHWMGARAKKYYFDASSEGRGYYHGWLNRCPIGRWHEFEVRYHPDHNAQDIAGSVVVCTVRIISQ